MRVQIFVFATRLIAGLTALTIGAGILIDPAEFHATVGIVVADQAGLRNELRAAGGSIFAVGLFVLCSLWLHRMTLTALSVAALIFGSYAAAKFYSFALDGMPNTKFLWVASLELFIAALCVASLAVVCKRDSANIH